MNYMKFRSIGIVICILLIATSLSAAFDATGGSNSKDNCLSYSFIFIEPGLQTIQVDNSQYTTLHVPGCIAVGQAGNPMMPVKSIKLLIPAMKKVININIVGNLVEIANIENPIFPYQNPLPIGNKPQKLKINTDVYDSDLLYPSKIYDGYHIGYCRGYAILDITLNPVQYNPERGKLFYYSEITVTLDLKKTKETNPFFRNNPEDRDWVEKLVYNPEIAETYNDISTFGYPGGLCDPSDDYDYVIITTTHNNLNYWPTSGSIPYNWESLMDKHEQDDGLKCTLVTIQDINACSDYYNSDPLFNDTQAHIREFCKDAYEDWGAIYIFVGGDAEWIPARLMDSSVESNVDSDIYWNHLDSTFNEDHDTQWGEEGDFGFDLYAELFIGRITCDEPQDVSNWMTKSFYYTDATDKDYLENAAFYGGDTTWACQGDDFIDYSAIKGTDYWLGPNPPPYPEWLGFQYGFETWNALNPSIYNLSVKWTAEPPNPDGWQGGSTYEATNGLKDAINNDQVTLISAIAHANAGMSLDVSMYSWEARYHNTKPFFITDMGCHCGDMDAMDDGVLHSMLFHSDIELAFACVYNTGFGWGNKYSTASSSALQQKLFWDYLFDTTNNSGSPMNWQMGKAMAYSRDTMAPTIDWGGSWRETIQCCLLFGDPAQRLKPSFTSDPPEIPECPEGPTGGAIGVEYVFSTSTTDPEGEWVYYLWDWDDGTSIEWLGPYDSGVMIYANHSWNENGIYNITVKAKDFHGMESGWSGPLAIYIEDIKIVDISGGFGVTATIKNVGNTDAADVEWSITLEGGLILIGKEKTGTVDIPAGDEAVVKSTILGFGNTVITVTAECAEGSSDTKTQEVFIFLFFIKILDA